MVARRLWAVGSSTSSTAASVPALCILGSAALRHACWAWPWQPRTSWAVRRVLLPPSCIRGHGSTPSFAVCLDQPLALPLAARWASRTGPACENARQGGPPASCPRQACTCSVPLPSSDDGALPLPCACPPATVQILVAISTSDDCLLEWPAACHPILAALGRACLAPSPHDRPSFAQVGTVAGA